MTRTALRLEKEGDEAIKLNRRGKLAAGGLDGGVGADEPDLEEFTLREDMRRELEQLRIWVEKAGFSEREAQVHKLDMRTGYDAKAAARALDLKADTVRVLRKRYTDKLRKAAGF